jgi:hypothetical protein
METKRVPASCERKLASAERRLTGAIAHAEPRARLVADAERVRRAQLGVIKARTRVADIPTVHEDAQAVRHLANLEAAARTWQAVSVDEIIARYADQST